DAERTSISEYAIDARTVVAIAQLGVERNYFIQRRLEVGKILPRQLEFNFRAVRCSPCADFDAFAGDRVEVTGPQAPSRLQLGLVVAGPVHVDGALAPVEAAEVFVAARVEIPLDGISAPQVCVVGAVELSSVQRSQAGIKCRVVPHVEELRCAVFDLRL